MPSGGVRESLSAILAALGSEGFRLFFPLAAIHAALWPMLWTLAYGLDLPLATSIPPAFWHANEMIFGTYGAAVAGFITTAVPEWTDSKPLRGRLLFAIAGLWGMARVVGLIGVEGAFVLATIGDATWPFLLTLYLAHVSWRKRTTALFGFACWLLAFSAASLFLRGAFLIGDAELAQAGLHVAGLVMLGLLGMALSRITVPVTNLVLDPSEETSPYRPHPGRLHLAPGLTAVAIAAEVAGLSLAVRAYLLIAAGAAFLDRTAEAFIGREALRAEILVLAGSSLFAGLGLLLLGAARLGAPFPEAPGWHLALMGGLGLAVLAVFAIAGLRHTGRPLGLPLPARIAFLLVIGATLARALPDFGLLPHPPGPPYALPAVLWAAAFLLWLKAYWPFLSTLETVGARKC